MALRNVCFCFFFSPLKHWGWETSKLTLCCTSAPPLSLWGGKNNKRPSAFSVPELTGLAPGTAASQPTTPLPPLSQRTLLPGRGHSRPPATPRLPSSQGEGSACWPLPRVPYPGAPAAVPRVQASVVSWERGGEGARTRRLKSEGDEMHLPAVAGMPPFPGVLRSSAALGTLGSLYPQCCPCLLPG